jgi:hypothetical protein
VVPFLSAGVSDAKEILEACLAKDIPVFLAKPQGCGHGHACSPKVEICARPEDVPAIMRLMHDQWSALLAREGTLEGLAEGGAEGDEPPCPACGTCAPLQAGACGECGLVLE